MAGFPDSMNIISSWTSHYKGSLSFFRIQMIEMESDEKYGVVPLNCGSG